MKVFPEIGSVVKFKGSSIIGKCVGIVMKHYPALDENEDDSILMKPTPLPGKWCYDNSDLFAPDLEEIEPI